MAAVAAAAKPVAARGGLEPVLMMIVSVAAILTVIPLLIGSSYSASMRFPRPRPCI